MKKKILVSLVLSFCIAFYALAQNREISGKVTDTKGEGIPGVSVLIKGTTSGTATDFEGKYKLANVPAGAVLVYKGVGLVTQEIAVGTQSVIDVVMKEDVQTMQEVVVTGYADKEAKTFAGAASKIGGDRIENVPIATFDQLLQGQSPGLLVSSSSGMPGTGRTNVIIRGVGSFGNVDPLYVVDGVYVSADYFATLNPNDFESMSVLKDAQAASIYGARGSNGVIVVTTKKGKAGKTQFNYNFQYGITQAPQNRIPLMNTQEKIDLELQQGIGVASLSPDSLARLRQVETDWFNLVFRNGVTTSHQLDVQGGDDRTNFYISGSYFKQEGTIRNTQLDRYTLRSNTTHSFNNFRIRTNISIGHSISNFTREQDVFIGSPINAIRWVNPYEMPYDSRGEIIQFFFNSQNPNPIGDLFMNKRETRETKIIGGASLEYDIPNVKGLTARTRWGIDYTQREGSVFLDRRTYIGSQAQGGNGSLNQSILKDARLVGTTSLNYSKTFGQDHSINAGVFYELSYVDIRTFGATAFGFTGRLQSFAGSTPGAQGAGPNYIPTVGGSFTGNALSSYFFDASYDFRKKYFINIGARRDGSSKFGANRRFGNFYSVGASWIISDEDFMQSTSSWLNTLKLRASVGTLGNQNPLGDFTRLAIFGNVTYAGVQGIAPSNVPNPDLQWEASRKWNVAVDYDLFKGRIKGSIEFYDNLTKDALLATQLSRTTGFTSQVRNVASIRNRGIEFSVSTRNVEYRGFRWTTDFNITYNDNKIISLSDGQTQIVDGFVVNKIGLPIRTLFAVPYVGVNPANGDALFRTIDGNLTNQYRPSDARPFGPTIAPYFGGFTNTFTYKGISLSAFFVYFYGNQIMNNDRINVEYQTYINANVSRDLLRAWRYPGQITDIPALSYGYPQEPTSRYIEDGSFLRLRNIRLAYSVPENVLKQAKLIRSATFYLQGQNLLTFTKYLGQDPETANDFQQGQYPQPIITTFGMTLGF
ncbi:MAG: TonB-dependent receptor [Microscillaceae bacterium]|nr:TonB-dependent receptor [Microscillaceae bacterium]MDW8460043.1 TonB-dependent receptor [Cytophagales bacterium]